LEPLKYLSKALLTYDYLIELNNCYLRLAEKSAHILISVKNFSRFLLFFYIKNVFLRFFSFWTLFIFLWPNSLMKRHSSQTWSCTLLLCTQYFYWRIFSFGLNNFVNLSTTCFIKHFLAFFICFIKMQFLFFESRFFFIYTLILIKQFFKKHVLSMLKLKCSELWIIKPKFKTILVKIQQH